MHKGAKYAEYLFFGFPIVFYLGALVGIVTQIIAFSSDSLEKREDYANIIRSIRTNINTNPFEDIMPYSNPFCPPPYERLEYGVWPGTTGGCYNHVDETLLPNSCSENKINTTESNWTDIAERNKRTLPKWDHYYLCGKRIQGTVVINATNIKCRKGYRLCNLKYCVPNSSRCALTSLIIDRSQNNSIIVFYHVDPNAPALIGFGYTQENLPCLNPKYAPKSNNMYPLIRQNLGCDQYGRSNISKIIEQVSEYSIFKGNSWDDIMTLPKYINYSRNVTYSLYSNSQLILANNSACQSIDFNNLAQKIHDFNILTVAMMDLVAYSILGLIFVGSTVIFICVDKEEADRERFERDQRCLFHTFHWMPYLMGILFITEANTIPREENTELGPIVPVLNTFINHNCLDQSVYNKIFEDIRGFLQQSLYDAYMPTRYMQIFSWICIATLLVIRGMRAYYRKDVKVFEAEYLEARYLGQHILQNTEEQAQENGLNDNLIDHP